jgi:hypothetical protein
MAMWRITRWYWYAIFWKQQVVFHWYIRSSTQWTAFFQTIGGSQPDTSTHCPSFLRTLGNGARCHRTCSRGELWVRTAAWGEHERTVESSEIRSLFAHSSHGSISNYLRWIILIYLYRHNNQRKLGSNTSELRMTFTWWNWLWWRVVRDLTIHSITILNKRIRSGGIDLDEGW